MHDIYVNGLSDVFFASLQEIAILNRFFHSCFINFHLFGVEFVKSICILTFYWAVFWFDPVPVL